MLRDAEVNYRAEVWVRDSATGQWPQWEPGDHTWSKEARIKQAQDIFVKKGMVQEVGDGGRTSSSSSTVESDSES